MPVILLGRSQHQRRARSRSHADHRDHPRNRLRGCLALTASFDTGYTWPLHGEDPCKANAQPYKRIDLIFLRSLGAAEVFKTGGWSAPLGLWLSVTMGCLLTCRCRSCEAQASSHPHRRVVVISDNARDDKAVDHRAWREQHAAEFALDFLPPYSPG